MPDTAPTSTRSATVAALRAALVLLEQPPPRAAPPAIVDYYSVEANPFGGRRALRNAARRLGFSLYRAGRCLIARRDEVDAAIAAHPIDLTPPAAPLNEDADLAGMVGPRRERKPRTT